MGTPGQFLGVVLAGVLEAVVVDVLPYVCPTAGAYEPPWHLSGTRTGNGGSRSGSCGHNGGSRSGSCG